MKLITLVFITKLSVTNAQIILSQNFEGPLTGWSNQGVIVSSQNSILPYEGSGILAINISSILLKSRN